jgi:hypothetical protein
MMQSFRAAYVALVLLIVSNEKNTRKVDDSTNNSNPSHAINSANYCCGILLAECRMAQSSNHKYICFYRENVLCVQMLLGTPLQQ